LPRRHPWGTALLAVLALLVPLLASAPEAAAAAAADTRLGSLDFPNSGAAAAQDAFVRGVLLLHSFEYEDAREAFREARRLDPGFALAYWGEAMTHNAPIWDRQDRDAARRVLAELAPTPEGRLAKAPTEREKAWLRTLEALYGEGDKAGRDAAYAAAMEELAAAYPDDLEARAFWSLSILGTAQGVRDFRTYMRAGAVAEEVFAANRRHPGALHYLIHSYDDPVHAPLGLRAARLYADVAPAASHAQHMISHIWVALGRWQESLDANETSFAVSAERRRSQGLGVEALNFHALHWLQYAYLQLGRLDEARRILRDMAAWAAEEPSPTTRRYLAAMRATWVAETADPAPPPGPAGGVGDLGGAAAAHFADGYAAWAESDREALAAARAALDARLEEASTGGGVDTGEHAAHLGRLGTAEVLAAELRALHEMASGRPAAAVTELETAVALEASLPLDYGPPPIVKPSHELLGEVLLQAGRPDEAQERFEEALLRAPRRRLSLAGLATAARASGDGTAADTACAELLAVLAGAEWDVRPPEACPVEERPADERWRNPTLQRNLGKAGKKPPGDG
jgi:tetratricopeptide (TPR) repeat protein